MRDILYAVTPDIRIVSSDVARITNYGKVTVSIQGPQYQFVRQESKVEDAPTHLTIGKPKICTELSACDQEDGDADMIVETPRKKHQTHLTCLSTWRPPGFFKDTTLTGASTWRPLGLMMIGRKVTSMPISSEFREVASESTPSD